jgi:hypothetical protein
MENTSGIYLVGDAGSNASLDNRSINGDLNWFDPMDAITTYRYLDTSNRWHEILGNASANYPKWRSILNSKGIKFIPNAYPGFDNTEHSKWENGSSEGVVLLLNEIMFKEMLNIAINNAGDDPKMVMITSWNEWLESTAIEPSTEYGELFLHEVYNIVPEFPAFLVLPLFMVATLVVTIFYKRRCFASARLA